MTKTAAATKTATTALGIDLGTTNSLLCAWTGDGLAVIPTPDQDLFPSVIRYSSTGEVADAGYPARNSRLVDPQNTVSSIKRQMGRDTQVTLGTGHTRTPVQVSADILRSLVTRAGFAARGLAVPDRIHAVVTVPAHFSESARRATIQAAEEAGIEVLRIINEPTAAALAFCHARSTADTTDAADHEIVMIYDLGGGTFDVSVVERHNQHFDVRSSEGNLFLGGDDFDAAIVDECIRRLTAKTHQRDLAANTLLTAHLRQLAESAKKQLSCEVQARIYQPNAHSLFGFDLDETLTRYEFENLIKSRIEESVTLCEAALAAAGVAQNQLNRILLVGGSSRIPLVHQALTERFPGVPLDSRVDPDLAVAEGAAMQAALILGLEVGTVLVDVAPASLGVATMSEDTMMGLMQESFINGNLVDPNEVQLTFTPLIRKNTSLPARSAQIFQTMMPFQEAIEVKVGQGEEHFFDDNELIGSFHFELSRHQSDQQEVEIALNYTSDGLVRVLAREYPTGKTKEVVFRNTSGKNPEATFVNLPDAGPDTEKASAKTDNVIIRQARRLLESPKLGAAEKKQMEALLTQYQSALAIDDANLDTVEDSLLDLIESLE